MVNLVDEKSVIKEHEAVTEFFLDTIMLEKSV